VCSSDLTADISCRVKGPYSILQKLTRKSVKLKELTDIVGLRIIVNEQDECYTALKLIQEIYKVIPEKYRDYINKPKTNGYRSLHTVILLGSYGLPVEIQIRTRGMHNIAENGKAAHSGYKQNQEQQIVTPEKLNLLTKAYEILDQDNLLTLRKISETRINVVILGRIKRKTQEVWLRRYWIYIRTI
jgi:(p)ppGpp synthase/HD superfamily hydrolase